MAAGLMMEPKNGDDGLPGSAQHGAILTFCCTRQESQLARCKLSG